MTAAFSESVVEDAALAWLESLGYAVKHGPEIAPGELAAERADYGQVVFEDRLRQALVRLNPTLPAEAVDDAFRKITRIEGATTDARNRLFHRLLVDGVTVEYRTDGSIRGAQAQLLDFSDADKNEWLAVNQFTVVENKHNRRPDVVIFVNGLPLAAVELKNAADENATIWTAYQQLQTYQAEIASLFAYNEILVISDGVQARIGSLGAGREWFKPWRTITGEALAEAHMPELQVMIQGVFDRRRFLDLLRYFVVFEDFGGGAVAKKIAGYHQFHAVNVAIQETVRASGVEPEVGRVAEPAGQYRTSRQKGAKRGDQRAGVVWHTQGSGKSLTMAFYAGRVILQSEMENPTLVVITDRNDLDDQLFGTFSRCQELLRQPPVQAESRADLRAKLQVNAGGIVFTTIQKFFPEEKGDKHPLLSNRRNVVVIADEAHRSQYDFIDGFARYMRDAPTRTVLDMLNDPKVGGGLRSTTDILISYLKSKDKDTALLLEYADRLGNRAVFKRLGFLLERFALVEENTIKECRARLSAGNAKLDLALPGDRLITNPTSTIRRSRLWNIKGLGLQVATTFGSLRVGGVAQAE